MRFKNIDIFVAIGVALLDVLFVQIPDRPLAPGIILALPLILFFPGYMLTQILLHRGIATRSFIRSSHSIGVADQLILSLGLSMAITILTGFMLNALSFGLQGESWTISLGLITMILALVTFFLRRREKQAIGTPSHIALSLQDYLLFGLALLVVTGAIFASIVRPAQPRAAFTQFWMLPANQSAQRCAVDLGIQSFETAPMTYYVVLTVNGVQANTWSPIALSPHEEWTQTVTLPSSNATSVSVQAELYRTNNLSNVYRNVHLTFQVSTARSNGQVTQKCTF